MKFKILWKVMKTFTDNEDDGELEMEHEGNNSDNDYHDSDNGEEIDVNPEVQN